MNKTDYKIIYHDGSNIHHMFFNVVSSEDAIKSIYQFSPKAKILEVHALKPEVLKNIININNIIKVDFKSRKRIA